MLPTLLRGVLVETASALCIPKWFLCGYYCSRPIRRQPLALEPPLSQWEAPGSIWKHRCAGTVSVGGQAYKLGTGARPSPLGLPIHRLAVRLEDLDWCDVGRLPPRLTRRGLGQATSPWLAPPAPSTPRAACSCCSLAFPSALLSRA